MRQNILFRHRIPLGQTDKPKDVRMVELELPESFKPHPLFREDAEDEAVDSNRVTSQEINQEDRPKEEPRQKEQLQGESRQEEPPKRNHLKDESPQSELPQEKKSELKARDRLRTLQASLSALTCDQPHGVLCHQSQHFRPDLARISASTTGACPAGQPTKLVVYMEITKKLRSMTALPGYKEIDVASKLCRIDRARKPGSYPLGSHAL